MSVPAEGLPIIPEQPVDINEGVPVELLTAADSALKAVAAYKTEQPGTTLEGDTGALRDAAIEAAKFFDVRTDYGMSSNSDQRRIAFYDGSEFRALTPEQVHKGELPDPLTTVALDHGLDKPVSGLTLRRGLVGALQKFKDERQVVDPAHPPMPPLPPALLPAAEAATPVVAEPAPEAPAPLASTSIEATPAEQLAKLMMSGSLTNVDGLFTVRLNKKDVLTLDSTSPEAMSALRIALGALLLAQENNPTD